MRKLLLAWAFAFLSSAALAQNIGPSTGSGGGGSGTVSSCATSNAIAYYTGSTTVGCATGITASNTTLVLGSSVTLTGPDNSSWTSSGLAVGALLGTTNAGSATNPEIYVGNTTTGLYSVSTTGLGFSVNGALKGDYGITNANNWTFLAGMLVNGNVELTTNGSSFQARTGSTLLSSPASATWQLGAADAASPVAQTLQVQSVVAGNANTAGVPFTIQGSLSNGSGLGGDIAIKTSLATAASGTQNTSVNALLLKAGTQHLSYGGSAPAVSACGTGSPAIDAHATDESGTVTIGTVATSCTITFAKAFTSFNHCRITSQTTVSGLAYSYTLSAITLSASVLGGDLIDYNCDGV
jgi:hypothetical protein